MAEREKAQKECLQKDENQVVFLVFCLWSFILLCRPQDYFSPLAIIRPGLSSTLLMFVTMFINSNKNPAPALLKEPQVKYYLSLIVLMVVGIPTALYTRLSFNVVFTQYIIVVLYFLTFFKIINSVRRLSLILIIGCLGSGVYFVFTLFQGALYSGRLHSNAEMFDPNDIAFFALVFFPLNLLFVMRSNRRFIRLLCLCAMGSCVSVIFLSASRGGLLAFILAMIVLLTKTNIFKTFHKVLILVFCLVIFMVSPVNVERYSSLLNLDNDYNTNAEDGRLAIWGIGLRVMLSRPLTGVGVSNFNEAIGTYRESRGASIRTWQTAHNSIIQIGTETGIIGMFLFILMSVNVLRIFICTMARSTQDELVRISELGLVGFVGMFTAAMFLSQAYSVYWAFYIVFSAVVNQLLITEQSFKRSKS